MTDYTAIVRNSCTLCNAVAARIADSVLESKPQHRIIFFFFTDHNRHILSVRRRTELFVIINALANHDYSLTISVFLLFFFYYRKRVCTKRIN